MAILDDDLLLEVLAGANTNEPLRGIYTTGCWYLRLARALYDVRLEGALSRALHDYPPEQQAKVLNALDDLPQWVGLVSWRRLVPIMRQLDPTWRLNTLASEAIAAALVTGAPIHVRTPNPNIGKAAAALHLDYRVVE